MKILMITNHSYMLYQFRRELIAELLRRHEVVISMPYVGHEEDFKKMGCRCVKTDVDRRGIHPVTELGLMRHYKAILKTERPDKVITYSIKPNIYAGILCGFKKIPYYANVQGLGTAFQKKGLAAFVTGLYKFAFRKVEKVFFENEGNAAEFRKRNILSKERQVVLKGAGVNLEYYQYEPYPQNEKVYFLYLGRIMKEKGIEELFYAIRNLHEEYPDQVILDMAGFYEDEYKGQAAKLVEAGIAVFHGFKVDPRPVYAKADCIVLPSYHEGMSNVLLEAAATGRPVITSDIPGCREAVDDGKSGYLCRVKNGDDLYRKMKMFVGLSVNERRDMGVAGREKMVMEFDKKIVVEQTLRVLEGR